MSDWFEHVSIRTKIWLLVLAILTLSTGILGFTLSADLDDTRREAHALVKTLSVGTAGEVTRYLNHTEDLLARLAARPLVKQLAPEHCDPMLGEQVKFHGEFVALAVFDLQGRAVCWDGQRPPPQARTGKPDWLGDTIPRVEFGAGPARTWGESGPWVSVLTYPVRDEAGDVKGLLVLPIDLSMLGAWLFASLPANAVVAVLDQQQAVLLHSGIAEPRQGENKLAQWIKAGREVLDGVESTVIGRDGALSLVVYQTLPATGWRVSVGVPEADVWEAFRGMWQRILVLVLGGMLSIIWLTRRVADAAIKPVTGLAHLAERVAKGDTQARVALDGPADIQAVATQFNAMLDAQQRNDRALRESNQALELSAARLKGVFESASDAILIMNDDHRIVKANDAAAAMFGWPANELIGASPDRLMPERYREGHQHDVRAFGDGHIPARKMGRARYVTGIRSSGEEFQVDASISQLSVAGERMYTVILRDVTERRIAEEALLTAKNTLDVALASMSDALLITDACGRFIEFNEAFATFHRCKSKGECSHSQAEAYERLDLWMANGEPASLAQWPVARALHGETASGADYTLRRKDTGESWVGSYGFAPIRDSAGAIVGAVVSCRDVTVQRRVHDALKESETRLRTLLMRLPDAVIVNSDNQISFVNEAAQRLLGAKEGQLLGRAVSEVLPSMALARDMGRLASLDSASPDKPLKEEAIVREDGTARIVETTEALIELDGQAALLAIMRDVTHLKQTQSNLQEAHNELQRLLHAQERIQDEERKRIARELHDDLQQTLAAISMDVSAAAQRLPTSPEKAAVLLHKVSSAALAAIASTRRIVNDLRPQMLEDLGLVPALEQMADRFGERLGVACVVAADADDVGRLPAASEVSTCLYRVAQEALNNIEKHADATEVNIALFSKDNGDLVLQVKDNGQGMDLARRHRRGSFGLLGMRERVRAIGANLRIDSRPGVGTSVEVHMKALSAVPARHTKAKLAAGGAQQALAVNEALLSYVDAVTESVSGSESEGPGVLGVAQERLLQAVIDALAAQAAVLNGQGEIVLVNRAWREFAEQNGATDLSHCGPGVSYIDICRRSAMLDKSAHQALHGLGEVLHGRQPAFVCEYPCDAPFEPRWFQMHAARMAFGGVLVTHTRLDTAQA
jgi:PAS domain S-box-containing protein